MCFQTDGKVMPKHKTISVGILDEIDTNNIQIGTYAELHGNTNIWCNLCSKSLAVDHGGMNQVNQHVKSRVQELKSDVYFSNVQPRVEKIVTAVEFSNKSLGVNLPEAECLWALKFAEED